MMTLLPRLKPNPVPSIAPVPEYAADPRLAAVYAATKAGLGVPWMGVVAMAFARYPTFYETLWSALEPLAGRTAFDETCAALRASAERNAAGFAPKPLTADLREIGYADGELAAIRHRLDTSDVDSMPIARADASLFAVRAATALVASTGGRAVTRAEHGQRLLREAMFLLVQGQTPEIRTDLLAKLYAQPPL